MFAVDLHAHTRFFHGLPGRPTPYDRFGAAMLAQFSRQRGMDAVALTNHDYCSDFDAVSTVPRFIPGIEVSTTMGHALVVGPDPPPQTAPYELTPQEVVEMAHEADCAAILPHPFRGSVVRESGADFDAVEINGKHPQTSDRVRELADELDLPLVAGSDAHYPFEAARAYTRVDAETLTPEAVVDAIRDGRVEPCVEHHLTQQVLQTAYGYVHRFKRWYKDAP